MFFLHQQHFCVISYNYHILCRDSSICTSHLRTTKKSQLWTLYIVNMWKTKENQGNCCYLLFFFLPLSHVLFGCKLSILSCRYKITDIIGKEEGLGVENLRGSGMIAGESSLAYDEIITMNLVRPIWVQNMLHITKTFFFLYILSHSHNFCLFLGGILYDEFKTELF